MHTYHDTQQSQYSTRQLFDLVIDIERYPEFLPWCRAARILERGDGRMLAELVISFKHITENYVSEVTFKTPQSPQDSGSIDVNLVRGPFKYLTNKWAFTPLPDGGAQIALDLSFKFRSMLLDSIIGLLFGKASKKMVLAFKERADALYGTGGSPV
jgi:coenzyme Q-binding protein COQ10